MKKIVLYFCVLLFLSTLLLPFFLCAQQSGEITELLGKGSAAYKSKKYDEAFSLLTKAYEMLRYSDHKQLKAMVELNIGITSYSLRKFHEALPYLEKAYAAFKEANSRTNQAIAADVIGASYFSMGQTQEGLRYFDTEASLLRELGRNAELAKLLLAMGKIRVTRDKVPEALLNYEEALRISRDKNLVEIAALLIDTGRFLERIGVGYCSQVKFAEGLASLETAIKIHRQTSTPIDIARSLSRAGRIYGFQFIGQYNKSLSYLQEALRIYRELGDKKGIAECHKGLGSTYNNIGKYDKALDNHQEAYSINTSLNAQRETLVCLQGIGFTYYKMGQYDKALRYFDQVLKAGETPSINFNIGLVHNSLGDNERAITFLEKALGGRKQDPMYLMSLGLAYTLQKNYKEAEKVLLQVEGMRRKATGHMWQGVPYLIELYIKTGRYDDALSYLKKMQPKLYSDDPYRILFHTQYGSALKGKALLKEASIEFLKAASISEEMRGGLKEREGFFSGGFAGSHIRPFRSLVALLSERALRGDSTDTQFLPYGKNLASAAFYFAESTKARVLLEEIAASSTQQNVVAIPDSLRLREANILDKLSGIQDHWEDVYKTGNEEEFRIIIEKKKAVKKELDTLISEMRLKYPKYAALYYPKPIPPEAVPLKDNEILLEYVISDDATYLFEVRKRGLEKVYKIEKGKEEIGRIVNKFALLLRNPSSAQDQLAKHAKWLYEILLEKPLKGVPPNMNLIIVPDGVLGLLPFEAFTIEQSTDGKNTIYVGDRHRITYFQSASILALNRMLNPSTAPKSLFALGDPIYSVDDERYVAFKNGKPFLGSSENTKNEKASFRALATHKDWGKTTGDDKNEKELEYPPLPETALEVNAIAGFFRVPLQPPDILLNLDANETSLRKIPLRNYRYLHFATHADLAGKVQGINEPFLLLGQVENNPEDNGFLTLTKVLNLDLDADLVVLSACLTGRGKAMEGEGVMNFARAFQHAGARSVVSSLWEVASYETVEFMTIFYSNLKEGKMKTESLSLARDGLKKKYPHPYYWAPFLLYGEQ